MARRKLCPLCGLSCQRTVDGTVDDGLAAHVRVVHPGHKLASAPEGEAGAEATPTPSGVS